tara:strand:- start:36502 stop:37599 length:1098 start_codon:yes stop_codon:yes gene_type:complete
MPGENFGYEGVTIRVESQSASDLAWMREFFHPWFDRSQAAPDVCVEYRVDPERFREVYARGQRGALVPMFMMDTHVIHHPLWSATCQPHLIYEEDLCLFTSVDEQRVTVLAERRQPRSRVHLMRVVRELAMGAAQARGGRFLHASAVAMDGRAIVMIGRRMAGKTSLLTYLLANLDARLLTNDRLLVLEKSGNVELRGMPTIVSVRNSMLPLFPALEEQIRRRHFTTRLTLEECRQADDSVFDNRHPDKKVLSPAQFCAAMSSGTERSASAGVLLFPRQSGSPGGIELRRMSEAETLLALEDGLFGHIGPDRLSGMFTLPMNRRKSTTDQQFLGALATASPAYQCSLGLQAYESAVGAEQIRRLL